MRVERGREGRNREEESSGVSRVGSKEVLRKG